MYETKERQARRDAALGKDVLAELDWHALIDASQLAVAVEDNVVTVVGTVPSMAEKVIVLDTVEAVDGVHDIVAKIDVKVPPESSRTDGELDTVIEQLLAWDALVPEQDLQHWVVDGWVKLRGSTATARQRTEAERVVSHLLGVRGVTNEIELASPKVSTADVRAALTQALERRAEHLSNRIDVIVDGHRVTLSGEVQSPLEKRAIVGAVSHAPGVEAVCEDLVVRRRPSAGVGLVG